MCNEFEMFVDQIEKCPSIELKINVNNLFDLNISMESQIFPCEFEKIKKKKCLEWTIFDIETNYAGFHF